MRKNSTGNPKRRVKRKQGEPREKPISLAPLNVEEALVMLLKAKPMPKAKKKQKSDSE